MNSTTLESLRYSFQRILVPCAVIIGVLGNSLSVVVLTRKRMRCSTNIYLTALAIADIIYLLMVLVLSFQHYKTIHHSKFELYWRTFGLSHWICDAASYTSIYITVSFTIERYIAVCHPIRGQILCTESKAKKVITVVVILCLLCTSSTTFEHQLSYTQKYINDNTGLECQPSNKSLDEISGYSNSSKQVLLIGIHDNIKILKENEFKKQNPYEETHNEENFSRFFNDTKENDENTTIIPVLASLETKNNCKITYFLYATSSVLAENELYKTIFLWATSIFFTFIPLILLLTFNSFLIMAVRHSNHLRNEMTNVNSRKIKQKISLISQENRITITLIAVVILFILCQAPTAIYIIVSVTSPQEQNQKIRNLHHGIGNIFNFLITFNAASNFLLYCALSEKYRHTLKELFLGRKTIRQNTVTSSFYFSRSNTDRHSWCKKNSLKLHHRSRQSSVHNECYPTANLITSKTQNDIKNLNENQYSNKGINLHFQSIIKSKLDEKNYIPQGSELLQNKNRNSHIGTHFDYFLRPSDSCGSLTRSQSVFLQHKTRHAPDCRDYPSDL